MVEEVLVTLGLGKKSVHCPVWVATMEDCIPGLDVLGALDCAINTVHINYPQLGCPHHCSAGS